MDQKEIQQYNNDLRIPQEFKESRIASKNKETHVLVERVRKPPISENNLIYGTNSRVLF